jgi:hypothetical protein
MDMYMCVYEERHISSSTYSNKRSSLCKTDDRIQNVWNSEVLVGDQTDTANPEAKERTTHHHLYYYFLQHLQENSKCISSIYYVILFSKYLFQKIFFFVTI